MKVFQGEKLVYEWKVKPMPDKYQRQYAFSHFNINQNYFDESMREYLPPTDCRLRPDQRHLENGNYESAKEEKNRLEKK